MTIRFDDRAQADRTALEFRPSADSAGMVLVCEQFLPRERDAICEFFADALNLQTLTPAWLHFAVLTPAPIRIQAGSLIDYRLRLHGIPLRWQSRIEVWEPPMRFVDVQTRGPYRRWHHEHIFEEAPGGTLCRDIVHYAVPGGRLIERLFVRPDLRKIFAFRRAKLRERFGDVGS